MSTDRAAYEKLIDYVEKQIIDGDLKLGDRLTPERELSEVLGISRNAVRTGLTVLETIGVVSNRQGSGNYISGSFDQNMVQLMTMMYTLDDMSDKEISGFRYAAELQAAMLAPQNITDTQRALLKSYADIMRTSDNESERIHCDKMIHQTMVEASGNRLVIANYYALDRLLDTMITNIHRSVSLKSAEEINKFLDTHQKLVDGICDGDYDKVKQALDEHFVYQQNNVQT